MSSGSRRAKLSKPYTQNFAVARPAQSSGQPTDLLSVAESPFIGREPEWRRLNAVWRNVKEHGPHLVLITGEPGIGKSRLAEELARAIRAGRAHRCLVACLRSGRPPAVGSDCRDSCGRTRCAEK